jgi:hypothetical protein
MGQQRRAWNTAMPLALKELQKFLAYLVAGHVSLYVMQVETSIIAERVATRQLRPIRGLFPL